MRKIAMFYQNLWDKICTNSGFFYSDSYGQKHSYKELRESILNSLSRLSDFEQQRVAILCAKHFKNYAAILGILFSRNTWIPLSIDTPENRNLDILQNLKPKLLVTDQSLSAATAEKTKALGIEIISIDELLNSKQRGITQPKFNNKPKDTSMIYYTSGSTGVPKGVKIKNESYINNIQNILNILQPEKLKFADFHDLSFVISIPIIFPCILSSSELFSANSDIDIVFPGKAILREQIDLVITVPSTLSRMISDENSSSALERLTMVVSCGEPLSFEILDKFLSNKNIRFFNFYGSTEVAPWIFWHECTAATLKLQARHNYVPIGELLPGNQMKIDNDGMLLINGIQVTSGYVGKSSDAHLRICDGVSWFPMNDAVVQEQGVYFCKGRMDGVVKIKGYRVHLSDVEHQLKKIKGVDECVCVLKGGKIIAVLFSQIYTNNDLFLPKARALLPTYMIPSSISFQSDIPLNKNGKIDRGGIIKNIHDESLKS